MARYIDAEKLEKWFLRSEWDTPDERWRPEGEFGKIVDSLPSEDVAPIVHSKWLNGLCSNCGYAATVLPIDGDLFYLYEKFCSNCGSMMEVLK